MTTKKNKGPGKKVKNHSPGRQRVQTPSSDRAFETQKRAFDAIAKMRHDNLPLNAAARAASTTPATVRRLLPAALRKTRTGRWVASKSDRYVRLLSLPGPHGPVIVRARGSEEARFASAYLASLARWARTEKAQELAPFHGKQIGGYQLITAPRTLRALRDAGLLQLDSLYAALKDIV